MAHDNNTTITATDEPELVEILLSRVDELNARVEKLNRRAVKLGLAPITVELSGVRIEHEVDGYGRRTGRARQWIGVLINGHAPRLGGFEFVARIDHVSASQNLIKRAPGCEHTVPVEFRESLPTCDHCHTNRRRNDTFVLVCVERETVHGVEFVPGMFTRVGRNCLADFLRTPNADKVLNLAALAHEVTRDLGPSESEGGGYGGGWYHYGVDEVLAATVACVRLDGWTSKAAARDNDKSSTASDVSTVLNPHPRDDESLKRWRAARTPTEADVETARKVREFVLSDAFGGSSDYVYNLKVLARDEAVDARNLGILVSAIACYRKHVGNNTGRGSHTLAAPVGKRVEFDARITNVAMFDTMFGTKTIVAMRTSNDESIVWKASGAHEFEVGATYHVRATVKEHGEYRSRPQTVVTRAKLTPVAA